MSRWEPNARERLQLAALELFHERGYPGTTVQEIAARAGLTERTFFRYFADKREVLFGGAPELQTIITGAIAGAPEATAPIDVVAQAIAAGAPFLQVRRDLARMRHAVVVNNAELLERELHKLTTLGAAMAEALRQRGVADPAASFAADAGIAIFKAGFRAWVDDEAGARDLGRHFRDAVRELKAVVGGKRRRAR